VETLTYKPAHFIGEMIGVLLVVVSLFAPVSIAADPNWYPSRYGAEDRIGALNNLSSQIVVETAKLITNGKIYSLAVETNESSHDNYSRFYRVKSYPMTPSEIGPNKFTANESLIVTNDGLGTSIDGFAHPGIGRRYYNGATEKEVLSANLSGVLRYGMESIPPIVSRGILLDMAKFYEVEALSAGVEFNSAEIAGAARMQGLEIRKGDVVIFHTGWLPKLWEDTPTYLNTQPGLGVDGARYLVKKGIALVGIDARTIEAHPANYKEIAPVHQELITKNGIHIIEHADTRALHKDKISEFMFVLGIPKLRGAVQGIVNPIAIK
jgi:hypothetical protein